MRDDVRMEDFDLDTEQGRREYNLALYADDPKMLRYLKVYYALGDIIGLGDIPEFTRQSMRRTVREGKKGAGAPTVRTSGRGGSSPLCPSASHKCS